MNRGIVLAEGPLSLFYKQKCEMILFFKNNNVGAYSLTIG